MNEFNVLEILPGIYKWIQFRLLMEFSSIYPFITLGLCVGCGDLSLGVFLFSFGPVQISIPLNMFSVK